MALAVVTSTVDSAVPGASKSDIVIISPGIYPTGGAIVNAAVLGVQNLDYCIPLALGKLDGTVNNFSWDQANSKVKLFNGSTEVSNATDLTTYSVIFLVKRRP